MADTPAKIKFNVSKITTITKVVEVEAAGASEAEQIVKQAENESEVGTVLISRTETKLNASQPRASAARTA